MENNKLEVIKKILHNLGITDIEMANRISNKITAEELSAFLLLFPVDKNNSMEISERIKKSLSEKIQMQITKVLTVIFEETGIEINENNKELLSLTEEEYEDYRNEVKAFFAKKEFYDEDAINNVINSIKVKYFKMFLKLYSEQTEEKVTTTSIAKKMGVSDPFISKLFTKFKEIIKEKTGLEINKSAYEKRKIPITDEETYKKDYIEYFQASNIPNDSKLETLFHLINQEEFRIFASAFPIDEKTKTSQANLALHFNIPLISLKRILQRIYKTYDELGIRFFEKYYENIEYSNLDDFLYDRPKTTRDSLMALKTMYGTTESTEIQRAVNELDLEEKCLILALKPIDGQEGHTILQVSKEFEIPRTEVVEIAKESIIQIRENVQRIKVVLTKEEKSLILEVADAFDDASKKIILLFFGMNNENRRYSVEEISRVLSIDKEVIRNILVEFINKKSEKLEEKSKKQEEKSQHKK